LGKRPVSSLTIMTVGHIMTKIHVQLRVTTMGIDERKRREKEIRRSQILSVAKRLFFNEGFQTVTVEKIAREAELAKGSIYLHFCGKEEIYTQILLGDIDAFYQRIAFLEAEKDSAAKRLQKFTEIYLDLFLRNRELFRIMLNFQLYPNRLTLSEELNQNLRKSMKKNIAVIERIFEQGIATGEFVSGDSPSLCRKAFWGLLNGIVSHYLFALPAEKGGEFLRTTLDRGLAIFLNGLRHSEVYPVGREQRTKS
jgi:AcrR family transcriptional regulator